MGQTSQDRTPGACYPGAVAIGTAAAYLKRGGIVEEIILVAHDDHDYQAYDMAADRWERMQAARAAQAQLAG